MDIEKNIQDSVIRKLVEYISSARFQRQFEQFFLDHALEFTDEEEHHLEYTTIYNKFQDKFNAHMEDFLASQNITEEEFTARFKQAIAQDPKAEQYLEIVLASMDYDAFYSLMKAMRGRASVESRRADAKETCPDASGANRITSIDSKASLEIDPKRRASESKKRQIETETADVNESNSIELSDEKPVESNKTERGMKNCKDDQEEDTTAKQNDSK